MQIGVGLNGDWYRLWLFNIIFFNLNTLINIIMEKKIYILL